MCVGLKVLGFLNINLVIEFNGKKLSSSFFNCIKTARFSSKFALKSILFSKLPCSSATMLSRFLQLWYRLTVFLPPLPEVGCPIFLEILNPWGKVMERSGLTFEHFCLKMV